MKYLWVIDSTAIAEFETWDKAMREREYQIREDGFIHLPTDLGGHHHIMKVDPKEICLMSEEEFDVL